MKQREDVISGGSYLSSNDLRPHFGLGQATKIDDIEVHWPDGKVEHCHRARHRPHRDHHRGQRKTETIRNWLFRRCDEESFSKLFK